LFNRVNSGNGAKAYFQKILARVFGAIVRNGAKPYLAVNLGDCKVKSISIRFVICPFKSFHFHGAQPFF
ncbi:MAG TPA: hypothetical protein V6C88_02645, partial [Chroococcidiopsis sp.]